MGTLYNPDLQNWSITLRLSLVSYLGYHFFRKSLSPSAGGYSQHNLRPFDRFPWSEQVQFFLTFLMHSISILVFWSCFQSAYYSRYPNLYGLHIFQRLYPGNCLILLLSFIFILCLTDSSKIKLVLFSLFMIIEFSCLI